MRGERGVCASIVGHGVESGVAWIVDEGLFASIAPSSSTAAKQMLQLVSYREGIE